MSIFIERSYKNFNTELMPMFQNVDNKTLLYLNELVKKDSLILITGDAGIGKTYHLKEYEKNNKNSQYINCRKLDINSRIDDNIEIILLDSFDEAIGINKEQFIINFKHFIYECKKTNPNIKIIISSRDNHEVRNILKNEELIFEEYKMMSLKDITTFNELVNLSKILIILGEPASGKTFQLREYANKNENTYFLSLLTLKEHDNIPKDTQVVLIDSIDEALTQNNQKILAKNLKEYILHCKKTNPNVKFVISCRFLEWSTHFRDELKTIDKGLREYNILPLSKEDINNLLMQKKIDNNEFWKFVDNNFLESLFNNVLIAIYLINNFKDYENKKVTYIDIYNDLSKRYLSEKGEDRENILQGIALDKLLLIACSLATYLLLNAKEDIESSNLDFIASELYKIEGENVVASDLEIVLNSNLYKKLDNKFVPHHKSIQEYLMAKFITNKNLPIKTIKELFASELRFYEEFEEVIVYLTNLKPKLFDEFVNFDPFIFKRHPNLTKEQQEKLLLSILNKYKVDFSQMWGRWESFEGSTLVKFEKLDNLISILKEQATLEEHGYYLMKLVKNNYTYELKEYIFEVFEKNIPNEKTLKEVIRENFIDNYEFNLSLYEFLKKYNLLEKDTHAFMMSFEAELFSSLYGIKYKYKYGEERIIERTDIDFNIIKSLLDFIPTASLKYIVPYLLKADIEIWFQYIVDRYEDDRYNHEFIGWVVHAVLKYCESKDLLTQIAVTLKEKKIYLHLTKKEDLKLDFRLIKDIFWEVYFETDILQEFHTREIVSFYNLSLDDIKMATDKYPIKNYVKKYVYFRLLGKSVDEFLMQDEDFKIFMQNEWERQRKQQEEMEREFDEKYPAIVKQKNDVKQIMEYKQLVENNTEKVYIKSIENLSKIEDIGNIFNWLTYKDNSLLDLANLNKLNAELKYILNEKHSLLIEIIKDDWIKNKLYTEDRLLENEDDKVFLIYTYLFYIIDEKSIKVLLSNETLYEKLFWYQCKRDINKKYFLKYTNRYFDLFLNLSIERLKLIFKKNDNKYIGNLQEIIQVFKDINKFNKNALKPIINFLLQINMDVYHRQNDFDRTNFLEIILLDKRNYDFVYKLMINDIKNCSEYLKILFQVNTVKVIQDFFKIYDKTNRHKSFTLKIKEFFKKKQEILNKYDNPKINQEKKELYFCLIRAIKSSKNMLDKIPDIYYQKILTDYYEFFKEYKRPKGTYSPDIYDNMYSLINKIWNQMENSKYINILKELEKSNNSRLRERAKYALTKAYEHQQKDRNYPNSYYKEIFNKDDKMNKTTIHVNGDGNNIAVNSENINQTIPVQSKGKNNIWWLYSGIAGLITVLVIWWIFDTWFYAIVGGLLSSLIVWKLNPKFRFRNIGYALFTSGILSNIISLSGIITIPKNDFIHGVIKFGDNDFSIVLIIVSIPFFILDYFENKK